MAALIHILHLEDDPMDAELVQARLAEADLACRITWVQTRDDFAAALKVGGIDVILADYRLPTYDGLSALRATLARRPEIPYIFVSGIMGEEAAIDALTQGATDYVLKQNLTRLPSAIQRALSEARGRRERLRQSMINAARLRLMQFAVTHSLDELLEEAINEAEKETDSLIGFYAFIDDDQQSVTLQNWSTRTKAQFCEARGKGLHYPIADAGVWVDCFHRRKPVVHNDFPPMAHRRGLPEGLAEVVRELVVPVIRGDKVKAILGVGNKPIDYSETDVEAMSLLADLIWEITERKQAEASIRKLSQAVEQSPVSIVITDVDGNIEFVNAKFTQVTGYTYAEAIGKNPRILKSGNTPADEYRRLWETISSGGVWRGEFHNRKKNGKLFWEQATIAPIRGADDAITHYVAVKEDITERKKLDEQLRQIQKMEAIGQLAGGIAHDFNNILSAIIGYTELSLSVLEQKSESFQYLTRALEASGRAKELINQILMFSRETDQELKPIRLSIPVREALKLIRASVPATIEMHSRILSKASAMADPTQIHQIVMNLCTNAAQAMQRHGGLLEVLLTDITVDHGDDRQDYPDAKPGDYIRLAVSDQGHGIDAQYLHRIFDPFFTTKKIGEGTGMGLSVVHGIVNSYGGFIYVHSRLGEGSTFEILIPAQESALAHDANLDVPIPLGSESILFVDDETMIVDIVKKMLESLGYRVVARTSAMEALEAFKSNPDRFDLVITDMAMPKMTGLDLAEKIRRIRPDVPIVLCTGFDVAMNEEKLAEHGLLDIIYKPILKRDVATVVRNTLDRCRSTEDDG